MAKKPCEVDVCLQETGDKSYMTFEEVKKLAKEKGAGKYHGRRFTLFTKLTDGLYRQKPVDDIHQLKTTKRIRTVRAWLGGISDRQLRRLFESIEELEIVNRDSGTITYKMNFDKLATARTAVDIVSEQTSERNKDRAAKAREKRAEMRERGKISHAAETLRSLRPEFMRQVLGKNFPHTVQPVVTQSYENLSLSPAS